MKNLRFGLAVFISALAMPSFSEAGNGMSATEPQTSEFVNFAGTGPAGIASDTLPGGEKFLSLTIRNDKLVRGPNMDTRNCVEIKTVPAGTATMDTRIWMRKADGSLVSLNDDVDGGKFSKLWVIVDVTYSNLPRIPGGNSIELLIAAKSPLQNSGNFHVVKTGGMYNENCTYYSTGTLVIVDQTGVQLFRTQ